MVPYKDDEEMKTQEQKDNELIASVLNFSPSAMRKQQEGTQERLATSATRIGVTAADALFGDTSMADQSENQNEGSYYKQFPQRSGQVINLKITPRKDNNPEKSSS